MNKKNKKDLLIKTNKFVSWCYPSQVLLNTDIRKKLLFENKKVLFNSIERCFSILKNGKYLPKDYEFNINFIETALFFLARVYYWDLLGDKENYKYGLMKDYIP